MAYLLCQEVVKVAQVYGLSMMRHGRGRGLGPDELGCYLSMASNVPALCSKRRSNIEVTVTLA